MDALSVRSQQATVVGDASNRMARGDAVVVDRQISKLQYTAIPGGIYFVVSAEQKGQL